MIKVLMYNLKEMKAIKTVSWTTYDKEYIYLSTTDFKTFSDGADLQ